MARVKRTAMIALLCRLTMRFIAAAWFPSRFLQPQQPRRTLQGTVTVSGKPGIDMPPGTLNSILKQAGIKSSL